MPGISFLLSSGVHWRWLEARNGLPCSVYYDVQMEKGLQPSKAYALGPQHRTLELDGVIQNHARGWVGPEGLISRSRSCFAASGWLKGQEVRTVLSDRLAMSTDAAKATVTSEVIQKVTHKK
ncbi:uncharacterized protein BO96DRAFT_402764 [Aspergillus niger CBS 101883]|uniref:Uncharacterized protein n=2 Tax=Aspergillus niger TaxID=5061 RepID=A2Q8D1_ASPNC|nr:uncharacterized protein BO96DRAFT_402764 [Aspergillus niger CBS 101883]XP_059599600.1 hypothetical protein An01g03920 [Aspergillus niger]PYH51931.1 hypothetical protein BO96DRAFT_402764 [Aspergillus niger CBS 101883]CAK36928.1 hypothetical protein An01g03920 [Aspergillus niger]